MARTMNFTSGAKPGTYQIQVPLGAGGIGEAYRALDAKLVRERGTQSLAGSARSQPRAHGPVRARSQSLGLAESCEHGGDSWLPEDSAGVQALVTELVERPTVPNENSVWRAGGFPSEP